MKSLRTRLAFTHALVAIIAVVIVAVLATALIRAAFNRYAPQVAANSLASDEYQQYQITLQTPAPFTLPIPANPPTGPAGADRAAPVATLP